MPTQQRKIRIQINNSYTAQDRVAIGNEIVSLIKERTDRGFGVIGKPDSTGLYPSTAKFPGYTNKYIQSSKFVAAFKNPINPNLKLSSKMLGALKLLSHGVGFVEIGFESGTRENAKAEGNILGTFGGNENRSKARNFLGITEEELTSILIKYPLPGDIRFNALSLLPIALLTEETETREFLTDIELEVIRGTR